MPCAGYGVIGPQPVKTGQSKNAALTDLLIPGENWQLVADGYRFTEGPAANASGEVFFNDIPNSKIYKVGLDGKVKSRSSPTRSVGMARPLVLMAGCLQWRAAKTGCGYTADGKVTTIAEGIKGNDLVVAHNGVIYVTEPGPAGEAKSRIWLIKPNGEKQVVDTGLLYSNGVTLSPDQIVALCR